MWSTKAEGRTSLREN
jgi:hypothetical protein